MSDALNLRPPSRYQDGDELRRFVEFCQQRNVRRYLEIGSRWGDSFFAVVANLPHCFGMTIDLPESDEKLAALSKTVAGLAERGHVLRQITGSSRDPKVRVQAEVSAPYDLIFIDGDHTYAGVRADWEDYHRLGSIIALHDVAAPDGWKSDGKPNGVGEFWRELKRGAERPGQFYGFKEVIEFVTPGSNMGYGIIVR